MIKKIICRNGDWLLVRVTKPKPIAGINEHVTVYEIWRNETAYQNNVIGEITKDGYKVNYLRMRCDDEKSMIEEFKTIKI